MVKVLFVLWIAFSTLVSFIFLYVAYRKAHPKLCECCKYLTQERSHVVFDYRYDCHWHGKFDRCPKYCAHWKPREDVGDDEN